jgi:mono/diheme cytochrome c family protein
MLRPASRAPSPRTIAVAALGVVIVGVLAAAAVANRAGGGGSDPAAAISRGRALYAVHCASCHGANLEGQPNWRQPLPNGSMPAPPHDATGHTWHHPDDVLFLITKEGGQRVAPPGYVSGMPGFGGQLSDAQIWDVLAYIKSTWPPEIQAAQRQVTQQSR